MVKKLVVILGDQLSHNLAALKQADKANDLIVMAEVSDETGYVPHHPKKIVLILSAMRKFAAQLRQEGWHVAYTQLEDAQNSGSLSGEILRQAALAGTDQVVVTEPAEWRVIQAFEALPLHVTLLQDDRFIASHAEFDRWAEGRKALRMEYFYRDMRRKTGFLMEEGLPAGGKWNFDHDNRKAAPKDITYAGPEKFEPDALTQQVIDLVDRRFSDHFGTTEGFWFATDRSQALQALDRFIHDALASFGDYQDAMLNDNKFLYHAFLSPYLNIGLLSPIEVCQAAEAAWQAGLAPLNAVEGFIRQIIGWREYMRGIYFHEGPDYTARNALNHFHPLPKFYWNGETKMNCLSKAVAQTQSEGYAHHIQRLMVTGNFALLAGIDPHAVHEWYLAVYVDAFEWVEAPNTIGMSQFADAGIIASKPYVSSGAYINRMSDYCKTCAYKVAQKTGESACPFNLLYWDFLLRNEEKFAQNPRMAQMYRTWARMDETRKETVLSDAAGFLTRLRTGELV